MFTQWTWRGGTSEPSPQPQTLSLCFSLSLLERSMGMRPLCLEGPLSSDLQGNWAIAPGSSSPVRLDNGWLQLTKDPFPSSKSQQFLNREGVKGNVTDKTPPSAANKGLFPTLLSWILNFPQVCLWQKHRGKLPPATFSSYHLLTHSHLQAFFFRVAPSLLPEGWQALPSKIATGYSR